MHHQNKSWRSRGIRRSSPVSGFFSGLGAIVVSFALLGTWNVAAQDATMLDSLKDTPAEVTPYLEDTPGAPDTTPAVSTPGSVTLPAPVPGPILPSAPPTSVTPQPPKVPCPVLPGGARSQNRPEPDAQPMNVPASTAYPHAPIPTVSTPTGNAVFLTPPTTPRAGAPLYALLVPSQTPAYAGAAQVVLSGFSAGAKAARAGDQFVVIEHEVGHAVEAYNQAIQAGARVVVGPLVRDDLRSLAQGNPPLWTIALTQLDEPEIRLPEKVLPLTLAIESDARLLAHEIALTTKTGLPVLLSNETPLMRRFCDAFIDEWGRLGNAQPPGRILFDPQALAALSGLLLDASPSVVVLAVDGDNASLARAQTRSWMTYASGHIYRRALKFEGYLLDKVRVVEIPWLIDPGAGVFSALGRQPSLPASARLYALGFDAFKVAESFLNGRPTKLDFWGASGNVHYDPGSGLTRSGQLGVFDQGQLRPLGQGR